MARVWRSGRFGGMLFCMASVRTSQSKPVPGACPDLIIVGAGAAGLMAGVTAGEMGLRAVIVERKHLPGRKLLMSGNGRCNLTSALPPDVLLERYGEPVAGFLCPAIEAFSPRDLCNWLREGGLIPKIHKDRRVFPRSERAPDVLRFFTDRLRRLQVPLLLNCPVTGIRRDRDGLVVQTGALALRGSRVLVATGGVSYPKTGSVGDGQKYAKALGHRVHPYRAGLAGLELEERWLCRHADAAFPGAGLRLLADSRVQAETGGELLVTRWGAVGPCILDASRQAARQGLTGYHVEIDLAPFQSRADLAEELQTRWRQRGSLGGALAGWLVPPPVIPDFCRHVLKLAPDTAFAGSANPCESVCAGLKAWPLHPVGVRPLKEAIVTVGGVDLEQVDPDTLASRLVPGLHFAGEVLDVDGPTGGFNLQAAFSTARLAVRRIAGQPARSEPGPGRRCQHSSGRRRGRSDPRSSSKASA